MDKANLIAAIDASMVGVAKLQERIDEVVCDNASTRFPLLNDIKALASICVDQSHAAFTRLDQAQRIRDAATAEFARQANMAWHQAGRKLQRLESTVDEFKSMGAARHHVFCVCMAIRSEAFFANLQDEKRTAESLNFKD